MRRHHLNAEGGLCSMKQCPGRLQTAISVDYRSVVTGLLLATVCGHVCGTLTGGALQRPHIIVVTVDDVGLGDVSYASPATARLSNIDGIIRYSTVLTSMYAAPYAHASRVALNTGRHPATLGNQHEMQDANKPFGVAADIPLLSESLKKRGYATHAVGQWDLGFYATNLVPTSRGFDTFYGSHLPYSSYDNHIGYDEAGNRHYDLHYNTSLDHNPPKLFKVDLYAEKAREIIARHNKAKPLYLYVALQAARMYDMARDCEAVPQNYYPRDMPVEDKNRACFLAYMNAVDHALGKIKDVLLERTMLIDSVILFLSLSTGAPAGHRLNSGSNAPLRGQRGTLFEGGLRVPCFLLAPFLNSTPRHLSDVVHMADWYHTLLGISDYHPGEDAGSNRLALAVADRDKEMITGLNILPCLLRKEDCVPRGGILLYAHKRAAALRSGNFKLIFDADGSMSSAMAEWYLPVSGKFVSHRVPFAITCGYRHGTNSRGSTCGSQSHNYCLFDVVSDPCEYHDLSMDEQHHETLSSLQRQLAAANASLMDAAMQQPLHEQSHPPFRSAQLQSRHGWQPWVSAASHLGRSPGGWQLAAIVTIVTSAQIACSKSLS